MLAKSSVIGKPHTTTELTISAENEQFVTGQVLPAMREGRSENKCKDGKRFAPGADIFHPTTVSLGGKGPVTPARCGRC